MSEEEDKKAQVQRLRDLFEGAKGRQPETDQELQDWLASPEVAKWLVSRKRDQPNQAVLHSHLTF